jgi:glutamate racemase
VACNTATAHALPTLETQLDVPVVGVVEPGVQAALEATKRNRIGVIATHGTVNSGAYQAGMQKARPECTVFAQACPLFVPLAEEGWSDGDIPLQIARHYLAPLLENDIDTLVLGCTHYPLLKKPIQEVVGDSVKLIDSAEATAACVLEILANLKLQNQGDAPAKHIYLVSDAPERFIEVGSHFLGETPQQVEWVDF